MPSVLRVFRGFVVGLAVLSAACAERREPAPVDGACESVWHCELGLLCDAGRCRPPSTEGGPCDPQASSLQCAGGLACAPDRTCRTPQAIEARREVERQAREREMLRASGVAPEVVTEPEAPPTPEAIPPPAGPGLPVRVVRVEGRGAVLAACRSDERLLGGSCAGTAMVKSSFPSHHGPVDTVGARWNCETSAGTATIEAYALCQALPYAP